MTHIATSKDDQTIIVIMSQSQLMQGYLYNPTSYGGMMMIININDLDKFSHIEKMTRHV